MKKHILNLVLCLALVLALGVNASAATLNTANLRIEGSRVTVGSSENEALAALHSSGRTAKLAIPYAYTNSNYYVEKDGIVVTASAEKADGYIRFPVPGAGVYEIKEGTPATLDEQLSNQTGTDNTVVPLPNDGLNSSYPAVKDGTVIIANGPIKGVGGTQSLSAEGSLVIKGLNGSTEIELSGGDRISFDTNGNATVTTAENKNKDGKTVGYGSFCLTGVNAQGTSYTKTYFLVKADGETEEETFVIKTDGTVEFKGVLDPVDGKKDVPDYRLGFQNYDNSYQQGNTETIVAECNGLFDHFVTITLTLQNSGEAKLLASRVDGNVVKHATGVNVEKGSTKLTLENSYLNTLPAGDHTLTFTYDDAGYKTGTLKVVKEASAAVVDPTNPKTGDNIFLFWNSMLLTGCALAAFFIVSKKKA